MIEKTLQLLLKFLTGTIVLFAMNSAHAQDRLHSNYTVKDGLPSNKVYGCVQDDEGVMWFYTDAGIAKLEGSKFKIFTVQDGLPDNDIWQVTKGSDGKLWIHSNTTNLCYIEYDSISCIDMAPHLANPSLIYFNNNAVHFLNEQFELVEYKDGNLNIIHSESLIPEKFNNKGVYFLKDDYHLLQSSSQLLLQSSVTKNISVLLDLHEELGPQSLFRPAEIYYNSKHTIVTDAYHEKIFILDLITKKQVAYDFKTYFKKLPARVRVDESNGTYTICTDLGYLQIDSNMELVDYYPFEENLLRQDITRAYKDANFNLWICSRNNGVYLINNKMAMVTLNQNIGAENLASGFVEVNTLRNEIYFGNSSGGMFEIAEGQTRKLDQLDSRFNKGLLRHGNFISDLNLVLYSNSSDRIRCYNPDSGEATSFKVAIEKVSGKDVENKFATYEKLNFQKPRQNITYVAEEKAFIFRKRNTTYILKGLLTSDPIEQYVINHSKLNCYSEGFEGMFLGFKNGLFQYANKSLSPIESFEGIQVNGITLIDDQTLIVGTEGKGLFLMNRAHEKIQLKNETAILDVEKDAQNQIYYLTKSKVVSLKNPKSDSVQFINLYDLSLYNINVEFKEFEILNDTIYASTNSGLFILPINKNPSTIDFQMKLKSFSVNDSFVSVSDPNLEFQHDQNTLKFQLYTNNYHSGLNNVLYEYSIDKLSSDPIMTKNGNVVLGSIGPGDYEFRARALDPYGVYSTNTIAVNFTINKPWWNSILFRILVGLILFGTARYFYLRQIKKVEKEERDKASLNLNIASAKLEALQSQMNPHFIFNALNSIQNLIQNNEVKKAEHYLAIFSSTVRKFLDSSSKTVTNLKYELELIEEYLQLEKLRFGDKINYKILNEVEHKSEHIEIPSFLIQPMVENAIKHGLFHKKGIGNLTITVTEENETVVISIVDDGIGRKAALEMARKNQSTYKSKGTKLVEQKIEFFNKIETTKVTAGIIDLMNGNESAGTKVVISIANNQS